MDGMLLYFEQPEEIKHDMELEEILEIQAKNMAILAELDGTPIEKTGISQEYGRIFGNGVLIAADNQSKISALGSSSKDNRGTRFYDKDLNFIREVKTENGTMPSLGMNEDYFFYMKRLEETDEVQIWAIDLHKLDDPNLKGEPFFVSEE